MYKTLLWATDGSTGADNALDEALTLLEPGGRVIAFHADQRFHGARVGGEPVLADEGDRKARIRARVAETAATGLDIDLVIATTHRSPAHAIVAAAQDAAVDAIVIGTRGIGGLQGALLGSVARELLHYAHVPVVVVPNVRVPATV
jgi:nucleotide-binding universal stress UspA family protein